MFLMDLMMKYLLIIIAVLIIAFIGVKDMFTPFERKVIDQPIYTIGDSSYKDAIGRGQNVVKLGPVLWGLYKGGLAFSTAEEAQQFYHKNRADFQDLDDDWFIIELSGDFVQDAYLDNNQYYIKHSLLVLNVVRPAK